MAIPFFSIDMRNRDWKAYMRGLTGFDDRADSGDLKTQLQSRFADYYISLYNSARLGFYLVLASSFKQGDEIIFPSMGFPLYIKIAQQLGIKPVLVDVEPEHLTIDPDKLRKAMTPSTKAIVVTHMFGHPAYMDAITAISTETGVPIIEDCAQAFDTFYKDKEVGTFGWAGVFSCSLMKVPTTLGGGFVVTKDKELHDRLEEIIKTIDMPTSLKEKTPYHVKGLISILNSYPLLYTMFSHHVFGLIKSRNPSMLRSILYSGMGMQHVKYNPAERPALNRYQQNIGAIQFDRTREMTEVRRNYSGILDDALAGLDNRVTLLREEDNSYWNRQYHVIDLGPNMDAAYNALFAKGIHVMKEDCWDCTSFGFDDITHDGCDVAKSRNPGLLRLPNNSLLTEKQIRHIADSVRRVCDDPV